MSAIVPQIVASPSFLGRTTALPSTILLSPTADATYQLSFYLSPRAAGLNISLTLTWTDDGGSQSSNLSSSDFSNSTSGSAGTITFRHKGGHAIDVATAISLGSGTYDLYCTLIQL